MEGMCTSFFMLSYVSTAIVCCYLQNAYGDQIFVKESATCVGAIINCMMDYKGEHAFEPDLDQCEQDTVCTTPNLYIWLWNRKSYTCKFQDGTATTQPEDEQSTFYEHLSSSSSSTTATKMIIQDTAETLRYICVTNGVMGNKTDLCDVKDIPVIPNMEQPKNYVEAIIGLSVGAVAILAMLVLLILYKRRTRERPTPYWPNTSNRSDDDGTETVIIESAQDSSITEDTNDHHYTLPKTTSLCVKMVNLVRPAQKKTTDVRAWASEADLHSLPFQCSERPHRGLCFTTSVGSKSGAVSAPDIHVYETIEPCNSTYHRENTGRCKNCKTISKPYCQTDGDHGYIEFFATSGAASAPDLHLYEELKPCSCIDKLGKACNCIKYTSLRLQSNPLLEVHDDMNSPVISGSASAPDLT